MKYTYEQAKEICDQAIAIGKALGLKFDERFPPPAKMMEKALEKLLGENDELKQKIKKYDKEI